MTEEAGNQPVEKSNEDVFIDAVKLYLPEAFVTKFYLKNLYPNARRTPKGEVVVSELMRSPEGEQARHSLIEAIALCERIREEMVDGVRKTDKTLGKQLQSLSDYLGTVTDAYDAILKENPPAPPEPDAPGGDGNGGGNNDGNDNGDGPRGYGIIEYPWERDIAPFIYPARDEFNYEADDIGVRRRFYDQYRRVIRRIQETDQWWVYTGKQWQPDAGVIQHLFENVVYRAVNANLGRLQGLGVELRGALGQEERAALERDIERITKRLELLGTAAKASYVTSLIKNMTYFCDLTVKDEEFDKHRNYVNYNNCTVDVLLLRVDAAGRIIRDSIRVAMHDHCPEDLQVDLIPYDLNPDAEIGDRLQKFIYEIHNYDQETADCVMDAVGYSITGYPDERTAFIQHGEGDNGKGTFNDLLGKAFGSYATTAPISLLLYKKNSSEYEQQVIMAGLQRKRLIRINEPEINQNLDVSALKHLTGGEDEVTARVLNHGYTKFRFAGKIFLATNHLPTVSDTGDATWKRIKKIPYETQFVGDKQDRNLSATLEEQIDGFLILVLEGAARWIAGGKKLKISQAMIKALEKYRGDEDDLAEFENTCFDKEADRPIPTNETLRIYKEYIRQWGREPMSDMAFIKRMGKRPGWKHEKRRVGGIPMNCFIGWKEKYNWRVNTGDKAAIRDSTIDQNQMLAALRAGPGLSMQAMCDALKWTMDRVESTAHELLAHDEIEETGEGYRLKKDQSDRKTGQTTLP